MAKNPMQRKAQNSFLLGMLITFLITGLIMAVLILQLTKMQKETKALKAGRVSVCVLNSDVKSGQVITDEMIQVLEVNKDTIPSNAFGNDASIIDTYRLEDTKGNALINDQDGNLCALQYDENTGEIIRNQSGEVEYKIVETTDGLNYYYQETGKRVELTKVPVIAKVDITKNTVLTSSLIVRSNEKVTNDIRRVEYNMILLPSQLENGKYIDIRLRLPNGADYIVVSHKEVEIPSIDGVESLSTIAVKLSEMEILTLSGAIVEAYQVEGAKLYAIEYVDPGLQESAVTTYVPSNTILRMIQTDKNCVNEARKGLWDRLYNKTSSGGYGDMSQEAVDSRKPMDSALNQNSETGLDNLKSKVEQEIEAIQEERQKYLESLGATY